MAAEELIYGKDKVSSGASSDFRQATSIATTMVASCGMSDAFGKVSVDTEDISKKLSPEMRRVLDVEVRSILDASYERVCHLLKDKESVVRGLAENVIKKETLQEHEILEIAGLRTSTNSTPTPSVGVAPPTAGSVVPVLAAPVAASVDVDTELAK